MNIALTSSCSAAALPASIALPRWPCAGCGSLSSSASWSAASARTGLAFRPSRSFVLGWRVGRGGAGAGRAKSRRRGGDRRGRRPHVSSGAGPEAGAWKVQEDVVDAVLYLERATLVTGDTLHVDGGQAAGR